MSEGRNFDRAPFAGLAGIGDEAAADLPGQLAAVARLGWRGLELRTIGAVPIAALGESEFEAAAETLAAAGVVVPVVDSGIAGWARPITADYARDEAELEVLARRCPALGTSLVRIMSYPNDGFDDRDWRTEVLRRIRQLTRRAEQAGLTLLHENCSGWAGVGPEQTLDLLAEVDSPALALLFDTGNGAAYGYQAYDFLRPVAEHVRHVHVKDADDTADGPVYRLPGEGGARVADCLRLLMDRGYSGWLCLEPHLSAVPHQAVGADGTRSAESFQAAGLALEDVLRAVTGTPPASASALAPAAVA